MPRGKEPNIRPKTILSGPASLWCDNDSASPCDALRTNGSALDVVEWDWARLREQFPNAEIVAST